MGIFLLIRLGKIRGKRWIEGKWKSDEKKRLAQGREMNLGKKITVTGNFASTESGMIHIQAIPYFS